MKRGLLKFFTAVLIISNLINYSRLISLDSSFTKILSGEINDKNVSRIFSGIQYEEPLSQTLVAIYNSTQAPRNCVNLNLYIEKILAINPRNGYAHYINGVCYEQSGDLKKAKKEFEKACKYQKFNPEFIYGLALLQYKNGELIESKKSLIRYRQISKDLARISELEKILSQQ